MTGPASVATSSAPRPSPSLHSYRVPRGGDRGHAGKNGDAGRPRSIGAALVPLLPALGALAVRLHVGPLTIDDAFITYRYARNFAEGLGLVYNPGQAVLGTTTPLYALMMAALYRFGVTDLPTASWVLN